MRLAITLLAILLGVVVAVGAFYNAANRTDPTRTPSAETATITQGTDPAPAEPAATTVESTPAVEPARETVAAAAPATPATFGELRVLPAAAPGEAVLGSTDPESGFRMQLQISRYGAGVTRVALTDYHETVQGDEPYVVHGTLKAPIPGRGDAHFTVYPYAARSVLINGAAVNLETAAWSVTDRQETAGSQAVEYRLTIADGDRPVIDIIRRYELSKRSYDFRLRQRIENRTDSPVQVAFEQYIQGDLPLDDAAYLGDRRMYVTGYFHPEYDAARTNIYTTDAFLHRSNIVSQPVVWPNPSLPERAELAWLASENRYFAVVTHSLVPEKLPSGAAPVTSDIPPLEKLFPRLGVVVFPKPSEAPPAAERALAFTLTTAANTLAPGAAIELPLGVFAGPREHDAFEAFPYGPTQLNFGQLVRYELSCAWCTFQPLARGLLWLLEMFHAIVRDWGIAIVLLVLLVRLILHPITKKAQANMMKMGKQMQAIQPEVEKLKKKYSDDQTKLNQEVMKLYREKNINPANMLGCLPMLLQTPIWIALYAMLYFAIELRHQHAFYGLFQQITGGAWEFLADLSSPDYFWRFAGEGVYLDRIPGTQIDFIPFVDLHFAAINILPILMGVVFYFNMKFTSPPPPAKSEAEMTEQQKMMAQQQKIMRVVFPFMMPVFLYSAPSGLTLYICASTFAGIIDSYLVRKHVREAEASGKLFETKPVKPGSLRDKMQKYMERKQAELVAKQQNLQRDAERKRGPGDKRR